MPPASAKPSSSSFEGDFAPGEVLIGRYRIIALVGEGGMGQVYLADDLVLAQPVALKFLPQHVAEREGGLERFRAEVRHAREVTHPNVARVHDIGEVAGRHFLTMEFVDGEDLASLVKRIGRLPREKAAEIAQQICAGLAEAHRRGVLHRDLKPANVMLDGEGRVKITDFGLAVPLEAGGSGAMAGTPAYMAPEQLAGLPASERTEVYALGLVLYELYTGQRALRGRSIDELRREHEEGPPNPPSSVFAEIDSEVDAVLARCLARDPAERPASVRDVARRLPGGDPLAAAIAEGRTPSPELVAAAETGGALAPRAALAMAIGSVVLFVAFAFARTALLDRAGQSYGKAPAVLDERARELFVALAGGEVPRHEVHWYELDIELVPDESAKSARITASEPGPVVEVQPLLRHTRFAPEPIAAASGWASETDPAPIPGSAHLVVDASGRLVSWTRWPDDSGENPDAALDGARLLTLAGLDPSALRPIEPDFVPRTFADERLAWEVPKSDWRVHAAGLDGRAVQLELLEGDRSVGWTPSPPAGGAYAYVMLGLTAAAAFVGWHNVRRKRGYVSGALAVGAFALATHLVLVFAANVPTDRWGFINSLYLAVSMALHTAFRVFVFYLALEPFARRHWPGALISWTRLLEGRIHDPAVGREFLVGTFVGLGTIAVLVAVGWSLDALGVQTSDAVPYLTTAGLGSPLQSACEIAHLWGDAVMYMGIALLLLVALRVLVRRAWLGNGLWIVLFFLLLSAGQPEDLVTDLVALTTLVVFLLLLTRLGFLAVVAFAGTLATTMAFPQTLRPDDWTFGTGVLSLLLLAGLVTWAYRAAVAGRSAFG